MIDTVCKLDPDERKLLLAVGVAAWQSFEAWLGRTQKVKAGSTPELLFNGIKNTLAFAKEHLWKKPTI